MVGKYYHTEPDGKEETGGISKETEIFTTPPNTIGSGQENRMICQGYSGRGGHNQGYTQKTMAVGGVSEER